MYKTFKCKIKLSIFLKIGLYITYIIVYDQNFNI